MFVGVEYPVQGIQESIAKKFPHEQVDSTELSVTQILLRPNFQQFQYTTPLHNSLIHFPSTEFANLAITRICDLVS